MREKRKSPGTLRKKYGVVPPVTPDAYVHETSINECFDQIWVEVSPHFSHSLIRRLEKNSLFLILLKSEK